MYSQLKQQQQNAILFSLNVSMYKCYEHFDWFYFLCAFHIQHWKLYCPCPLEFLLDCELHCLRMLDDLKSTKAQKTIILFSNKQVTCAWLIKHHFYLVEWHQRNETKFLVPSDYHNFPTNADRVQSLKYITHSIYMNIYFWNVSPTLKSLLSFQCRMYIDIFKMSRFLTRCR